ncbi:hypothetical protein TNCV_3568141 [Trichonephila clavipes]|nr:hypothetical protein TNCV_3568141 [Trichonephila clavipes]
MIPARTWPCRAAYSNASGLSGSVTVTTVVERCSGKASIGSMTKCLKHLSLLYVSNRMRFNKEGSRGVFKCVRHSTNMNGLGMSGQTLSVEKILGVLNYTTSQYHHGWTMDARSNLECGS